MWLAIWRLTKMGLVNFWRNLWLNLLATFVMSLTLMTISVLLMMAFFVNTEIENIENKIDFEIYLNDGIGQEKVDLLKQAINNSVEVKEIIYIDKVGAVERYKEIFGDSETLINYIEQENPLKESLVVRTYKPGDLEIISGLVESELYKDVVYSSSYSRNRDVIVKLIGIIDFIEKVGLVVGLVFIIIAVAVVFSTVRIAIYSRKDEIEIMKLVGATDWFVHAPFLIESGVYGVLAAVISCVFVGITVYYVSLAAGSYLGFQPYDLINYLRSYVFFIVTFQILLGVTISVSSAFVAIRRHLK